LTTTEEALSSTTEELAPFVELATTEEIMRTTTPDSTTTVESTTTEEALSSTTEDLAPTAELATTEEIMPTTTPDSTTPVESTTAEVALSSTIGEQAPIAELASTEEMMPTTTPDSTTTEESTTTAQDTIPTTSEEKVTTADSSTTDQATSTADSSTTVRAKYNADFTTKEAEEASMTTTDPMTTEAVAASKTTEGEVLDPSTDFPIAEVVPTTSIDFMKTDAASITTTKTREEFMPTTSTTSEGIYIYHFNFIKDSDNLQLVVNEPLSTEIVQETIDRIFELGGIVVEVPADCFTGIGSSCAGPTNEFVCAENAVSDMLVADALSGFGFSDIQFLSIDDDAPISNGLASSGATTSILRSTVCANSTEKSWIEIYKITTTKNITAPNTSYGITVLEKTPYYEAVSFLQIKVSSFGVSSVQYACFQVDNDVVTYQNIPASIGGFAITEDQYKCSKFKKETVLNETSMGMNATELKIDVKVYPDLQDGVGLIIEVSLAAIYIAFAVFYAYRAYKQQVAQRTRSGFKTTINIAFFALFTVWASGNLIYLAAYFFQTRESNYYIKQILTLTFFITYLLFVLVIHYRYHPQQCSNDTISFRTIYNRIHAYPLAVDGLIVIANILIHLSYLGLTTSVEYCTLIDRNTGNPRTETCNTLLSNNVVIKWYTSMGLILAFWAFIIDFIMGSLLVIAISRVRRIRKALDEFSKRYRNWSYNAFAAWAFLLALVTTLAFVHAFHPGVYNTIHINSIVNLLIEVINTLQVYSSTFLYQLVCCCL
jgi:hypothetical protein